MYVHPMVRDSMLIWNFYHDLALPAGGWICSGTPTGIDQWVAQVFGERFHVSRRELSPVMCLFGLYLLTTSISILQ